MSLDSWAAEFYAEPATEPKTEIEAVDHCIRKWEGLRRENLRRHGLVTSAGDLFEQYHVQSGNWIRVNSDTCALCVLHQGHCSKCILAAARDGTPCYDNDKEEISSPYDEWIDRKRPESMIFWLVKAKSDLT